MSVCEKYFGLYRGTVVDNVDLEGRGRLLVSVPTVLTLLPSTWAEPSMALAGPPGPGSGSYIVPAIGTGVWVQFEQGDQDYPIWTGCRVTSAADVPPLAQLGNPVSPPVLIQSLGQQMFMISDSPLPLLPMGGILLSCGTSYIRIDKSGVSIFGSTILINGNAVVAVNGDALTVFGPAAPA